MSRRERRRGGRTPRWSLLLLGSLLAGIGVGALLGYREISMISEELSVHHPEDPQDGLTFIFYGFVFLGGVAGLACGGLLGICAAALRSSRGAGPGDGE